MPNIKNCLRLLFFVYLLLVPVQLPAADTSVFVIAHNTAHKEFAVTLQQQLNQVLADILPKYVLQTQELPLEGLSSNTTIITLGKVAFSQVLYSQKYKSYSIFATMISSRDYFLTLNQAPHIYKPMAREGTVSALYSDPSVLYQLTLSSLLFNNPLVAFIYTQHDLQLVESIRQNAMALGLPTPLFIPLEANNINETLKNHHIAKADLLIATPNPQLYNSKNVKKIIFSLLDRQQALIGYSTAWVKSGALATVYSSQKEVTKNLAGAIRYVAKNNGQLPRAAHPSSINVKINHNIAKMLRASVYSDEEIATQLRRKLQAKLSEELHTNVQ